MASASFSSSSERSAAVVRDQQAEAATAFCTASSICAGVDSSVSSIRAPVRGLRMASVMGVGRHVSDGTSEGLQSSVGCQPLQACARSGLLKVSGVGLTRLPGLDDGPRHPDRRNPAAAKTMNTPPSASPATTPDRGTPTTTKPGGHAWKSLKFALMGQSRMLSLPSTRCPRPSPRLCAAP